MKTIVCHEESLEIVRGFRYAMMSIHDSLTGNKSSVELQLISIYISCFLYPQTTLKRVRLLGLTVMALNKSMMEQVNPNWDIGLLVYSLL